MRFQPKYSEEFRDKRERDRFEVEFSKKDKDLDRETFNQAKIFIQQSKDATALKQLATLGYFAISGLPKFIPTFRDIIIKNDRNNKRLGLDVKTEIESKFRERILKKGGEL